MVAARGCAKSAVALLTVSMDGRSTVAKSVGHFASTAAISIVVRIVVGLRSVFTAGANNTVSSAVIRGTHCANTINAKVVAEFVVAPRTANTVSVRMAAENVTRRPFVCTGA